MRPVLRGFSLAFALLLFFTLFPLAGPAGATSAVDDGTWSPLSIGARFHHSAIYDPVRDRMVVFGGSDGGQMRSDVWALALESPVAWTKLAPGGPTPAARRDASAIYDPVRDRLIVYGGSSGVVRNDVWALSLGETPAWTQLLPTGTLPAGHDAHRAVHDPVRDRMIVIGGGSDDVWALSLGEAPTWTHLAVAGTPPAGRAGHTAVYDAAHDRIIVYGGFAGGVLGDVWALSLAGAPAWTELAPAGTAPPARFAHAAVYDPGRGEMVVFGGYDYQDCLEDTWTLSLGDSPAWSQLAPALLTKPIMRHSHTMVLDPVRDRVVVCGGWWDGSLLNDVLAMSLGDAPAWTDLTPTGKQPYARYGHTAVYDPVYDRMVMFGGNYSESVVYGETWTLSLADPVVWTQWPLFTRPTSRGDHSAIHDPVRQRMIIFGGRAGPNRFDTVWALSLGATPAWTQLSPVGTPPSARAFHAAIYDPVRDRMLVFGGHDGSSYLGDIWALSLGDPPTWTEVIPAAGPGPEPRGGHAAIYDPVGDRMVVFGGFTGSDYYLSDVWVLSLGDTLEWTALEPTGVPPDGVVQHRAIYDPVRDRMVVYGGFSAQPPQGVMALSLGEAPAWSELTPAGASPDWRYSHSAVYDPVRDRMVVFQGAGLYTSYFDSWVLTWGKPTVPVQLALVSAEADPDRVRLTWYAAEGNGLTATVCRRTEAEAWSAIGQVTADGTGQLSYEDRTVVPGTRYGYRLGVMDGGVETFVGEAWVDVPVTLSLALAGARPNPAEGLAVAFSLPDGSPARLEAFDLAGRRVRSRDVGSLGAGSHVVKLADGAQLGCGMYVVRLTRGERTLTTRAVIVR